MRVGLVQVYTGPGKGKTTASLGLALRAIGHNHSVYIIQFLKGEDTGEMYSIAKYLPNVALVQFGIEALNEKQLKIVSYNNGTIAHSIGENHKYRFYPDEQEKDSCKRGFEHAKSIILSGDFDLVILDEINCAVSKGLIPIDEVMSIIKKKPKHVEIVLTGRGAPTEIIDIADLVTQLEKVKHPFDEGIPARKGIEY